MRSIDIIRQLILLLSTLCHSLDTSKPDWRWQLTASGRFAHRKEYIATVGKKHDLEVVHYEKLDGFRHEHGKDVRGHLFVMKKVVVAKSDEEL